jgi:hypothetical protein
MACSNKFTVILLCAFHDAQCDQYACVSIMGAACHFVSVDLRCCRGCCNLQDCMSLLLVYQRPMPRQMRNLGSWNTVLLVQVRHLLTLLSAPYSRMYHTNYQL